MCHYKGVQQRSPSAERITPMLVYINGNNIRQQGQYTKCHTSSLSVVVQYHGYLTPSFPMRGRTQIRKWRNDQESRCRTTHEPLRSLFPPLQLICVHILHRRRGALLASYHGGSSCVCHRWFPRAKTRSASLQLFGVLYKLNHQIRGSQRKMITYIDVGCRASCCWWGSKDCRCTRPVGALPHGSDRFGFGRLDERHAESGGALFALFKFSVFGRWWR